MDNVEETRIVRVVLIGESGVGKTSIMTSFLNKAFCSMQLSTSGGSFNSKTLFFEEEKKFVKFDIWDTAGQERYRTIVKSFYKSASVVIMVYDITNANSFLELQNYWYNQIKENSENNIIFFLVGNKNDMYLHEKVKEQTAGDYAKDIEATFKLTSAKEGTGIDELFKHIGKKFLNQSVNGIGMRHVVNDKSVKLSEVSSLKENTRCC